MTTTNEVTTIKTSDNTTIKYTPDGDIKEYSAPGIGAILGGVWLGSTANSIVSKGVTPRISSAIMNKVSSLTLSQAEEKSIFAGGQKALEVSGVKDLGVKVLRAGKTGITDWYPKQKAGKWKSLKNMITSMMESTVEEGKNAFFSPDVNKVVIPPKGKGALQLSVFHEIGHSMNFNTSKIGKLLQKGRLLGLLALPIGLIALWKTKDTSDEKTNSIVDKSTDFVKDNAGKLTFATFLPTLIEEGMASIKGNKLAKNILKPQLASKVAKCNGIAYLTYLTAAVMAGLGMWAAVSVKDKIASKNQIDYNKHFDFDGDGSLSTSEKAAKETYVNGRKDEQKRLFEQFDINKNGKLEKEEIEAMKAFLEVA